MNNQEREYFELLVSTRQSFFNQIKEAEKVGTVEGYWDSVVDKYSDQAHFIYEILQNADDAMARNAHFELYKDCLVFRHDGKRRFSISNPDAYQQDKKENKVGDINGITSIGASGKFFDSAKIGKFGLGFKAVFQYTLTPSIYDDNVLFKIHDYIIPQIIAEDFPGRKQGETVFVFPFNRPDTTPEAAFNDIHEKLTKLIFPNLFLNNLDAITYSCNQEKGIFNKVILAERKFGEISAQLIKVTKGQERYTDTIWLFSRTDEEDHRYSVGFFLSPDGKIVAPDRQYTAFCFFPTLVTTNLNFIIHAPFLLTDNREGIMAGNAHNKKMMAELARLAADGLECLCEIGGSSESRLVDDDIIDVVPFQENLFSPENDRSKVSFMPFFYEIRKRFQEAEILPKRAGFTIKKMAYWADTEDIPKLISDKQLSRLLGKDACFVFVSKGRNSTRHNAVSGKGNYIDSIVIDNIVEDDIYKKLTPEFIEGQDVSWLIELYRYILEGRNRTARISKIRKLPIFLDTEGKAVAAYDENDHESLFLPDDEATGYPTINDKLLKNEHAKRLLDELCIKKPEQEDRIFSKIIPSYINGRKKTGSAKSDFRVFLQYYLNCYGTVKESEFINSIKDLIFIQAITADGNTKTLSSADQLYMPTEELLMYFEGIENVLFVDKKQYESYIEKKDYKYIDEFLYKIGVHSHAARYREEYTVENYNKVTSLFGDKWPDYTRSKWKRRSWTDIRLKGGAENARKIAQIQSKELSKILWKQLVMIFTIYRSSWKSPVLGGIHVYPYYGDNPYLFEGQDARVFRDSAWLVNRKGEFVAPTGMSFQDLAPFYDTESIGTNSLIEYLKIEKEDESALSDSQREKIDFANKLLALGITEKDFDAILEYTRKKDVQGNTSDGLSAAENTSGKTKQEGSTDEIDNLFLNEPETEKEEAGATEILDKETSAVLKDIVRRVKNKREPDKEKANKKLVEEVDEDEFMPSSVDYNKKIERAKEKSIAEISKIARFAELQERVINSEKYSYEWFMALLEMESINSEEANSNSREISISFSRIKREPGTERTLLLEQPTRYIPQFMEDLSDIPLILHIGDHTKTVAIEVINVKSYTLRVKMKDYDGIKGVDLNEVTSAEINAQSPVFLIEELKKQFAALNLENEFNLQKNLCENIEFVFGPPGTGKTTHLAQNVLLPMMQDTTDYKVLVLTPTNKSADVLVRRIMEISKDRSYKKWLVRFGSTGEEIEQSSVFRGKTFDIRTLRRNVTVTTIARFPYDFFMPQGARIFLHGIKWDYIVIDEASMIPLANIVFPLYKKTPQKFIIAGDPFQIEPITSVDLWKNENIYTMVQLDSFTNPRTVPYQYKVDLLTTQYRSIPDIGYVFSNFVYGGILKHNRSAESQRPLNVGNDLGVETLNIIKFPVSKYESIYRCKRLQHSSSYQVYSALFTFEYVCYLSQAIARNNPGSLFKIGVIAPYRAQADMIDKLLASERLPKEVDVQVGTIHGFQGDECDIVFAVFNTPPTISASKEMFLNKRNIINVSISRARDYLFIVMPDDDTENISNLRLVKRVEQLTHETDAWNEFLSPDLEELMFGDSKYLENNAFSTSHQSVNVYGLPEKCYEVRTEDNAVDVQIHKGAPRILEEEVTAKKSDTTVIKTERHSSVIESSILDENLIPKELRHGAIDLPVRGAINGWCYLVPYTGKLKMHTIKKTVGMFVPQMRNGQEKMISVSVVEEDRIIYIAKDMLKLYEKGLSEPEGIELRKTFFG